MKSLGAGRLVLAALLVILTTSPNVLSTQSGTPRLAESVVWSGGEVPMGSGGVPLDGRYLAFGDIEGRLHLRDLQANGYQLRVMPRDGTTPTVLYSGDRRGYVMPLDWTPDGKDILAWTADADGGGKLSLFAVDGGRERLIRRVSDGTVSGGAVSPDGRWIAYTLRSEVRLVSAEGTGDSPLLDEPAAVLDWFPAGSSLLVTLARGGSAGAWALEVKEGKRASQPRLVRPNIGQVDSVGFARDGRFYFHHTAGGVDVHVAELDPATGNARGPLKLLRDAEPNVRREQATWAPDGKRIVFFRVAPMQRTAVVVMDAANGKARAYEVPIQNLERPFWHPNGLKIGMLGRDAKNQDGVFELDLSSGRTVQILGATLAAEFAPDGDLVYRRAQMADSPTVIAKRHVATGAETVVYTGPGGFDMTADSKTFLLNTRNNNSLWIAPAGGEARLLVGGIKNSANEFALRDDARYAYYVTTSPWQLWRVPQNGAEAQRVGDISLEGIDHVSVKPDGSAVALSGGVVSLEVRMWQGVR
jgi:Tol biopolymer transport system component